MDTFSVQKTIFIIDLLVTVRLAEGQ